MSQARIGRFFSIKSAAIALALVLGGLSFGAYLVYRVTEQGRISIGGFVLSGLLVLAGLGALAMAFPRGCKACSRAFTEIRPTFPAGAFEPLRAALAGRRGDIVQQQAYAPPAQGQVARIHLDYCANCRQIGVATVSLETFNAQSQSYDVRQMGEEHLLDGPMIATLLQVANQRAAMAGG